MSVQHDITFRSMGSDVRLLIGRPLRSNEPPAEQAAIEQQAFIEDFAARMSRFIPDSELSALNSDPRSEVPASRLLREVVRAGVWAAEATDGLVDSTLVSELEAVGYRQSLADCEPASLQEAPAGPSPRGGALAPDRGR